MGYRTRTRPGRLTLLDRVLVALETPLLQRSDGVWAGAPVVDLGIGAQPWTTVELAELLHPLPVVGVDHAEALVEQAQAMAGANLSFVEGSFDLPVREVRLIRAMNVLRDGPADAVDPAHTRLGAALLEGGLLIEGSCAPDGAAGAVHWIRKTGGSLVREGLVMWFSGARGLHPMAVMERLPRDLLDAEEHPIHRVLRRWRAALAEQPPASRRLEAAAEAIVGLRSVPIDGGMAFQLDWDTFFAHEGDGRGWEGA